MCAPLGDQAGSRSLLGSVVRRLRLEPSGSTTQMSSSNVNAMRVPSGAHAGCDPLVRRRRVRPSRLLIRIPQSVTNATDRPSAEKVGSPPSRNPRPGPKGGSPFSGAGTAGRGGLCGGVAPAVQSDSGGGSGAGTAGGGDAIGGAGGSGVGPRTALRGSSGHRGTSISAISTMTPVTNPTARTRRSRCGDRRGRPRVSHFIYVHMPSTRLTRRVSSNSPRSPQERRRYRVRGNEAALCLRPRRTRRDIYDTVDGGLDRLPAGSVGHFGDDALNLDRHASLQPARSPDGRWIALFTFVEGRRRIQIDALR